MIYCPAFPWLRFKSQKVVFRNAPFSRAWCIHDFASVLVTPKERLHEMPQSCIRSFLERINHDFKAKENTRFCPILPYFALLWDAKRVEGLKSPLFVQVKTYFRCLEFWPKYMRTHFHFLWCCYAIVAIHLKDRIFSIKYVSKILFKKKILMIIVISITWEY